MGKYTVFINENMGEVNWEMVKKAEHTWRYVMCRSGW